MRTSTVFTSARNGPHRADGMSSRRQPSNGLRRTSRDSKRKAIQPRPSAPSVRHSPRCCTRLSSVENFAHGIRIREADTRKCDISIRGRKCASCSPSWSNRTTRSCRWRFLPKTPRYVVITTKKCNGDRSGLISDSPGLSCKVALFYDVTCIKRRKLGRVSRKGVWASTVSLRIRRDKHVVANLIHAAGNGGESTSLRRLPFR